MTTAVALNGVAYTGDVLTGLRIQYGRQKVETAFPAAACSMQLVAHNTAPTALSVRDVLAVDVYGVRCFWGRVTDLGLDVAYADSQRVGTIQAVIATGALADMGRVTAGSSSYPAELDGTRAGRIISEAAPIAPTINSVTAPINSVGNSLQVYRSQGVETVDAGTVTLLARTAATTNALTMLTTELDPSAPGVYETPDGRLGYAAAGRRLSAAGTVTIPASLIDVRLGLSTGVADVVNDATVTWGSPEASVTVADVISQGVFGIVHRDYKTKLSTLGDATALANRIIASRASATLNVERLVVDLEHPNMGSSLRTQLLGVVAGTPVRLTGLDTRLGLGATWFGFVEGWTLTIGTGRKELQLNVSAKAYSIPPATLDTIQVNLNSLGGTIADLGATWSTQRTLNQANTITINSATTTTLDTAYQL